MAVRKFVLSEPGENSNKVWQFEDVGNNYVVSWGRIGNTLQTKTFSSVDFDPEKKVKEKIKKGYEEVQILGIEVGGPRVDVAKAAQEQLASDPDVKDLVKLLIDKNRHELSNATGGKITIDSASMAVKTEVGAVTLETIDEARTILNDIGAEIEAGKDADAFSTAIGKYLRRVPQRVGNYRGWHHDFLATKDHLQKQSSLLDQLEASAKMALDAAKASDKGEVPKLFDCTMKRVTDRREIDDVSAFFMKTLNHNHHAASKLRVKKVFDIDHAEMTKNFEKMVGNVQLLWHGTRVHNLLSILKSGLICPKSGGSIAITGRMFGDGLYFSPQSTKSLQYAIGNAPGQYGGREAHTFMLLVDVAVGKHYTPSRPGGHRPAGYDSIWAKGGQSGVMNDEVIVPRVSQARLRRLVEFG